MKNNIFLTSDAATVMKDLVKYIDVDKNKKVLFVNTAGELHDNPEWIDRARDEMRDIGFEMVEYTITDKNEAENQKAVDGVDIVYIAGGNAFYLLQKVQESGFLEIMKDFIKNGGIYIGQSAGSYLAGPTLEPAYKYDQEEWVKKLDNLDGFGLVDFTIMPHFGREDKKETYLQERFKNIYGTDYKIILLTDSQYIRVQDDGMYKIEEVI